MQSSEWKSHIIRLQFLKDHFGFCVNKIVSWRGRKQDTNEKAAAMLLVKNNGSLNQDGNFGEDE